MENTMQVLLDTVMDKLRYKPTFHAEPNLHGKWIIDLPPTDEIRLGPFRTQQEALDARREYIIRTLSVNLPKELPF
jgi:hypothetical protein